MFWKKASPEVVQPPATPSFHDSIRIVWHKAKSETTAVV